VTDQLLAALVAEAQREKPRFFAICGVYENPPALEGEESTYVEWGLEFPNRSIAVTWTTDSLVTSSSAEEILNTNAKMGPARLVWLEAQ
jgi:hypothetical protein